MQSKAKTVKEYLASLPADRRQAMSVVRELILKNIQPGFEEVMQYGMIGYAIPWEVLSNTYNGQRLGFVGLASQKHYMSLYLLNVYGHKKTEIWFKKAYKASGKKLNMGKSCLRFKKVEDLALDVIAQVIARTSVKDFMDFYLKIHPSKK